MSPFKSSKQVEDNHAHAKAQSSEVALGNGKGVNKGKKHYISTIDGTIKRFAEGKAPPEYKVHLQNAGMTHYSNGKDIKLFPIGSVIKGWRPFSTTKGTGTYRHKDTGIKVRVNILKENDAESLIPWNNKSLFVIEYKNRFLTLKDARTEFKREQSSSRKSKSQITIYGIKSILDIPSKSKLYTDVIWLLNKNENRIKFVSWD